MALKPSKLNQIPQRNKDLAFGYVKECEISHNSSIPKMIKYLCLIYLNQNKDEFDSNNTHKDLTINGQSIIRSKELDICDCNSCLLVNEVNTGINIWTFQNNGNYFYVNRQ